MIATDMARGSMPSWSPATAAVKKVKKKKCQEAFGVAGHLVRVCPNLRPCCFMLVNALVDVVNPALHVTQARHRPQVQAHHALTNGEHDGSRGVVGQDLGQQGSGNVDGLDGVGMDPAWVSGP